MTLALALLLKYKYLVLFPLAFFEGPVVSLVVGFMIYLGYLSFFPSFLILIFGDIIPDTIYYYCGRFAGQNKFIQRLLTKNIYFSKKMPLVEHLWNNHPKKTMFFSKLAYGLSTPFLVSAGLVRMPFKKFISYTIPITLFQYAVIMTIGYVLGNSYYIAEKYIKLGAASIAIFGIVLIVLYFSFSKYAKNEIDKLEI